MFAAFARALAQLGDPAFRRPLVLGLVAALAVFAGLWTGMGLLLTRTRLFDNPWLDATLDAFGGLATLVLTVLLYPAVVAAVMSLFLDDAIQAVEARHYPGSPPPRPVGLGEQLGGALRLVAKALVLNLLALPIYLVPGLNLVVFYTLNGYLLGREYFEMVAQRRLDPAALRRLWHDRRAAIVLSGAGVAFISTIPLVNLVAPLIAAAAMTHQVMSWIGGMEHTAPGDG
jgi:CysZ protein